MSEPISIDDIGLPPRVAGLLKKAGILTQETLLEQSVFDLLRIKGVGRAALHAIWDALSEKGDALSEDSPGPCANHTPCPSDSVDWHAWAQQMGETHQQRKCPTCGLYAVWVLKQRKGINATSN